MQHALMRALERPASKAPIDNVAAWVVSVATNEVRRRGRRRQLERRTLKLLMPLERSSTTVPDESAEDLRRAFGTLSFRQRQVVALFYFHDLDVKSIADVLVVSEGTVKKALSRARTRLASALVPSPNPEPEVNHV